MSSVSPRVFVIYLVKGKLSHAVSVLSEGKACCRARACCCSGRCCGGTRRGGSTRCTTLICCGGPACLYTVSHTSVVGATVFLVQPCRLGIRRRFGVGVTQKRLNGGQDCGNVKHRAPLLFQDVQADGTILVHVWMKHFCDELDVRCDIRVILRELEGEGEGSTFPHRFLRSKYDRLPLKYVAIHWCAANALRGIVF